jgi:hypothetical protein
MNLKAPATARDMVGRLPMQLKRLRRTSEALKTLEQSDRRRTELYELVVESKRAIDEFRTVVAEHNLNMPWKRRGPTR